MSCCTPELTSSPSTPKLDGLLSLKHSLFLGTAVIVVFSSGGTVGSAQGDVRPVGRRDPCWLLHPGSPSLVLAQHPTGTKSVGVVTSTVTGAVASTAGPAVVRCLAIVQKATLVKIKGLFHYSGSPSNYLQTTSCGSLQVIQAVQSWSDIALQPREPWVAAALSDSLWMGTVREGALRGHSARVWGWPWSAKSGLCPWSSSAEHLQNQDIRQSTGRGRCWCHFTCPSCLEVVEDPTGSVISRCHQEVAE